MEQVGGGLWGAVRRGFSRPLWTGGPRGHGLAVCTKGPFPGAGEAGAETQATTEETEAPCLLTAHSQPAVRTASRPGSRHTRGCGLHFRRPSVPGALQRSCPRHLVGSLTPGSGCWGPESRRARATGT